MSKNYPPGDEEGYLNFAKKLLSKDVYNFIKLATPMSPIKTYRGSKNTRRHFEKLRRFPKNYLPLGDNVSSFNPLYGQGMTVSLMQAMSLNDCLENGYSGNKLRIVYFKKIKKVIDMAWPLAISEDFRWPLTEGTKPNFIDNISNQYIDKLTELAPTSPLVVGQFLSVANLKKSPETLIRPKILLELAGHEIKKNITKYIFERWSRGTV